MDEYFVNRMESFRPKVAKGYSGSQESRSAKLSLQAYLASKNSKAAQVVVQPAVSVKQVRRQPQKDLVKVEEKRTVPEKSKNDHESVISSFRPKVAQSSIKSVQVSELNVQEVKEVEKVKKTHERKIKWDKNNVLVNITFPREITRQYFTKRYYVDIAYQDSTGLKRNKRVYFGRKGQSQYIDTQDELLKMKRISSSKQTDDLFDSSYWRVMMLNRAPTLKEAYVMYMEQVGMM